MVGGQLRTGAGSDLPRNAVFRALDKKTGKQIAKIELPAQTNTAPMTFMHNGHQLYIVAAIASATVSAELVAIALPEAKPPRTVLGVGDPE
jgi:glucose dehydrogenase